MDSLACGDQQAPNWCPSLGRELAAMPCRLLPFLLLLAGLPPLRLLLQRGRHSPFLHAGFSRCEAYHARSRCHASRCFHRLAATACLQVSDDMSLPPPWPAQLKNASEPVYDLLDCVVRCRATVSATAVVQRLSARALSADPAAASDRFAINLQSRRSSAFETECNTVAIASRSSKSRLPAYARLEHPRSSQPSTKFVVSIGTP